MKPKILIAFLLISMSYIACKKDKSTIPFQSYLKYKMDGVQIECNEYLDARLTSTDGNSQMLTLDGKKAEVSIELELFEDHKLTAGQYVFSADELRRGTIWIDQKIYYAGDEGINNNLLGSGKITITEINDGFVKGTFDFKTDPDFITHISKDITEGEFYMKL